MTQYSTPGGPTQPVKRTTAPLAEQPAYIPNPNYVNPQPQPQQLPDYRPRGMSPVDKAFVWLFASVILVFGLTFTGKFLNAHISTPKPVVHTKVVTASPHATVKRAKK